MPSLDPGLRSVAGRLAAAERWRKPEATELRRELEAARVVAAVGTIDHSALARLIEALNGVNGDEDTQPASTVEGTR